MLTPLPAWVAHRPLLIAIQVAIQAGLRVTCPNPLEKQTWIKILGFSYGLWCWAAWV